MTWNVLKWVAIAAMLIDHTAAVMGGLFPFSWYDPMRDVGRIAFPMVELTPQNGGYAWQGEGDNWGITRQLTGDFYYYEAHF